MGLALKRSGASAARKPASRMTAAEREARVNLAACYRLVAHYGWTDLIYTHISLRVPGTENHYLLNPFGYMFDEITASSLIKIDLDGNLVEPSPHRIHRAGFVIHSAIHAARPDAHCVIHSHTRAGMAVSMMKRGLMPLSQHAMLFYGKVAYHESEGFALDLEERKRLADDLGDKPVMLLRNHGTLVAGETVAQAFSMMWHLEKAMQAQVDALASGLTLTMPSKDVAKAIAKRGFSNAKIEEYTDGASPNAPNGASPNAPNGASPLGRLEWPGLLRMLDRTDPSYRD